MDRTPVPEAPIDEDHEAPAGEQQVHPPSWESESARRLAGTAEPTHHLSGYWGGMTGCAPGDPNIGGSRALRVQLARVKIGHSPLGQIRPRSLNRGSMSDSQVDSAGSIPVTRSTREKRCHSWGFTNSTSPPRLGLAHYKQGFERSAGHPRPQTRRQHPPSSTWFAVRSRSQVRRW